MTSTKDTRQNAAVEAWRLNGGHGLIVATTGFGKSKIVCTIAQRLIEANSEARILWCVPTQKLRDTDVPNELLKWAPECLSDIDIVCYQGLSEDNHDVKSYDLIILDEAHHITSRSADILQQIGFTYSVGVTATPPKQPEKIELLQDLGVWPIVCNVGLAESIKNKWVANYVVKVDPVYMSNLELMQYMELDEKCQAIAEAEGRTSIRAKAAYGARARFVYNSSAKVVQTTRSAQRTKGRTLVFAGSVAGANEIAERLGGRAYHGGITKKKRAQLIEAFEADEFRHLVCVKALDEGANISKIESIVLGQCSSTERQAIQRVGRGIRFREGYTCEVRIVQLNESCDERWVNITKRAIQVKR